MSTHRSWKQRAGVVVALIAGALLAAPATPALAAEPTVRITGVSPTTVTSGGKVQLTYTVTAPKPDNPGLPGFPPVPPTRSR